MVVNTLFWCQQYLRKTHHHLMYLLHLPLVLLHAEIATIWQTVWDMPCKGNDRQFTIPKLVIFWWIFHFHFSPPFDVLGGRLYAQQKSQDGTFERTSRTFLWCCLLLLFYPHWRFLCFQATFPCHRHTTLVSQTRKCLLQLWALPWLVSIALFCQDFPSHFIASAAFLRGYFLSTGAFYLALLQYFFLHFVTRMRAGAPHLEPSSLSSLKELSRSVSAWSWTTDVWIE